jgi:DNA-cytosine methyltransferase
MSIRYLSLFSGIGGFEVGIQKVFPQAHCVGFSEISPECIKVYQQHFPNHVNLGPVQQIDGRQMKIDLLVGGSPCQDLSSTNVKTRWGKRVAGGLKGNKSGLFYEFVRLLHETKPKYFILENVGSMKNSDRDKISEILGVSPMSINTRLFAPQNRTRLFWTNIQVHFNEEKFQKLPHLPQILISPEKSREWIVNPSASKIYQTYKAKMAKYGSMLRMAVVDSESEYSPALLSGRVMWIDDKRIGKFRKMAPVEAERLQTFPEMWTAVLSYTNRFKVLGNAVTCDVISYIVAQIVIANKK